MSDNASYLIMTELMLRLIHKPNPVQEKVEKEACSGKTTTRRLISAGTFTEFPNLTLEELN